MEDLIADMNQTPDKKSKGSIFDSFKFWGQGPLHRKFINESINEVIDEIPIKIESEDSKGLEEPKVLKVSKDLEDSKEQPQKQSSNTSSPSNVKHFDTISGNHIISRGWDGNNMWEFKIRRK
ncbi:hypothetical protein E2R56_07140 [Rhodococcus qingshengii]|nr:hypothetical protein E2R56_07140 [Rhodococcus qingshengii]